MQSPFFISLQDVINYAYHYTFTINRNKVMNIDTIYSCTDVDWVAVTNTLKKAGMACFDSGTHKKAFENSYVTVFLYEENKLIGFGRAIGDGVYQAAIYDVVITPQYQGKGLGCKIINTIMDKLSGCSVILYASPGKEGFYSKLGFRKMKTGMAAFANPEHMMKRGFTE